MAGIIMGLIMGLLGGPALAMAVTSEANITKFEERKKTFEEGKGKNPELDPFGPHKSFKQNAVMFGLIFGAIGLVVGTVVS